MKKNVLMLFGALCVSGLLTSCLSEEKDFGEYQKSDVAKGSVSFVLKSNTDFAPVARALTESDYKNVGNYTVQILDVNNEVKFECLGSELASKLPQTFDVGTYTAKAFYGTEHACSTDDFRVEGEQGFTLDAKNPSVVEISCAPTCGKVSVSFDSNMSTYFDNYEVEFGGTTALAGETVTWKSTDTAPFYMLLDAAGEEITYTIHLTTKDGYLEHDSQNKTAEVTKTITLKRNAAYKLNVKGVANLQTTGTLGIEITIDDSTNDRPVTIPVPFDWTK